MIKESWNVRFVLFFLSVIVLTISPNSLSSAQVKFEEDTLWIETINQNRFFFHVELAKTPEQRSRGLMYRTTLADNRGMLFLFDKSQKRYFWMKNTYIPLDLLFLDQTGYIIHIHKNATPNSTRIIPSKHPALAVLEIQGGLSNRLGLRVGDRVIHSFFSHSH